MADQENTATASQPSRAELTIHDMEYWEAKAAEIPMSVQKRLILEVAALTRDNDRMRSLISRAEKNGVSTSVQSDADFGRMIIDAINGGTKVIISYEGATVTA